NNIDPKAVEKSIIPPVPTRLEMLRNDKVDVALLPEPFASLAIKDGGILLGSAKSEGFYPSVTAFTQESIDTKSTEIKAFYRAYNQSVEYINNTPITEYEDIIIEIVGYPEEMKGEIKLPTFRKTQLPSVDEVQSVLDWSKKNNLIDKDLKPEDLLHDIGL
ncbi:MAG: metal ABC transporter substrate-binding protein, partial [Vallitaleaceae bacterium]|nr:metal ABC transporter substrate-binding protein [Vallitaleaceae bacterium]